MNKTLLIILPIVLSIIAITISLIIFFRFKQVKYYKCTEKPNSDLLDEVLKTNNIIRGKEDFNLYMPCGYNFVEKELEELTVPDSKYIFALKGCDQIVSKNNLWKILEMAFNRSGAARIMPETYILSDPDQFYMAYRRLMNQIPLICKKNLQRKMGLKLVFLPDELIEAKKEDFKVAQIFLTNAKQIKDRKINLRVYYVVIKNGNKIDFYVNRNGKVLYTKEKTSGPIRFESHITSYQMDPNLYEKENLPHDFNDLRKYLGNQEFNIIWNKIIEKITAFSNAIGYVFFDNKYADKTCFQLFGMDIIIDGTEPYILEVNKGPDMVPKCKKDEKLKKSIYEQTFGLAGVLKLRQNNFIKVYSYL